MSYPQIYLASASPRRAQLLEQLGVSFQLLLPAVDESPQPDEPIDALVQRLAAAKAEAGWQLPVQDGIRPVLGADTLVCCDGRILGKPVDAQDATAMLEFLSGRPQQVYTAVALRSPAGLRSVLSCSTLQFRSLSATEIRAYVDSGEPLGKAGAYGIQGRGGSFVAHLAGSYSGVMGLPLAEVHQLLTDSQVQS